jgi:hypothetical protein
VATEPHWPVTIWFLNKVRERSMRDTSSYNPD